jgi:hypothetical protein
MTHRLIGDGVPVARISLRTGAVDVARHGSFGLARGAASEVAVALVLVMILAALIALILVAVGLVIVQRRSDRRRVRLPAGDDSIRRRSG